MRKKLIFYVIFFILILIFLIFKNFFFKNNKTEKKTNSEDILYNSNKIENVQYKSKDTNGNMYEIYASKGEIDYNQSNIVFLTNVKGLIVMKDSDIIKIKSDFGKYNIDNFDTIFSKNVLIEYIENTIKGEYLDFSIERNLMIISQNVVFQNLDNILKADVIEVNIKSKDTKIYRYSSEEKVNIANGQINGSN